MSRKIQIVLCARYLSNNWLLLLLKYILISLGLSIKLKAVIDTCTAILSSEAFARLVSGFSHGLVKSVKCVDGVFLVNSV